MRKEHILVIRFSALGDVAMAVPVVWALANHLPKVGDTITTTVDVMEEIFGMTLANSTVQLGKNILVTAEMKIALKNDGTESK